MPEPNILDALDYSRRLYERVIDWYKNADSKAQIILTLNGAFLAFLTSSIFKNPDDLFRLTSKFSNLTWLFLTLMCLCLVSSITCALMCLWSRVYFFAERDKAIMDEIEKINATEKYSPNLMLFFQTITLLDHNKFQTELAAVDKEFEVKALASQIYHLSKRVIVKHRLINIGFVMAGTALICFLVSGISYVSNIR